MSKETVKTQIDLDITNKTTSKSISPLNVGGNMKAVVDLIPDITSKEDILNKSINIITDNNSDIKYPTTKAVATYVDGLAAESWVNKSINIITDATSDTKYPSVKAVKTYVDANSGGTPQDLQSVIDVGGYAEKDGGNSYIFFIDDGGIEFAVFISDGLGNIGQVSINQNGFGLRYDSPTTGAYINASADGGLNFTNKVGAFTTYVDFIDASINTVIQYPAKTITGNYTINTTPNTIYTVATLPSAVLNDMAIVSDATAPTYLGTLVGGGSVVTPVWHNGTIWVSR